MKCGGYEGSCVQPLVVGRSCSVPCGDGLLQMRRPCGMQKLELVRVNRAMREVGEWVMGVNVVACETKMLLQCVKGSKIGDGNKTIGPFEGYD